MYGLIGKMIAQSGQREALTTILLEGTSGMPGCLSYIVANDQSDADALWITEVWDSQSSHAASLTLPAVKQAIAKGMPLITGFGERFETEPVGGPMATLEKTSLWHQFGAAIDTLDRAIRTCPDALWEEQLWVNPADPAGLSKFWYLTFHAIFWLDLYLHGSVAGFTPPSPFTLDELDPAGLLPERPYSKEELQGYLRHCRQKCHNTIHALTDETANRRCRFGWGEVSFYELQLYNMRHIQEHAAQFNLFLGQKGVAVAGWVAQAQDK
jgi:quinol monooxygenase YgiN